MAQVAVIARPGKISGESITITMHAVVQEQHDLANTITDHPVEQGFNVTDHSRPNPDRVTMECRISNTPLSTAQRTQAVRSGAFTIQTNILEGAGAIGAVDGFARSQWDKLRQLRDTSETVKVVTTLGDYDSMQIESLSVPRTAKNYDGLAFTVTLKKIVVVQNKLTRNVAAPPQAQKKKSAGNKTPRAATAEERSPLLRIVDSEAQSSNSTISGVGNFLLSGGK